MSRMTPMAVPTACAPLLIGTQSVPPVPDEFDFRPPGLTVGVTDT